MRRVLLPVCCALYVLTAGAAAHAGGKAKKRYYFEISLVSSKATLSPELEKLVVPRLTAEVTKQISAHPQLVTSLPQAPDPQGDVAVYRKYLAKRGLAGAYLVRVDLTSASEEVEPLEGRSGQRLVVRLSVHMFGETIPGQTMGFTGDGSSSIRQQIGKTLRPRDQEFTWQSAVELAVADAISTSLAKLSAPPKK
jgi:hypothetical protein